MDAIRGRSRYQLGKTVRFVGFPSVIYSHGSVSLAAWGAWVAATLLCDRDDFNVARVFTPESSGRLMPSTSDYMTKHDELQILINSRTPIITVETSEEDRLEKLLLAISMQMAVPFYTWSVTAGLKRFTGAPLYGTDDPEKALANIVSIDGDESFRPRISRATAETTTSAAVFET